MKIGIYNRYWGTMGGGEKHVGTIAQILSERHDVELICTAPVDVAEFQSRMNLDLSRARWVEWPADSCIELAPRSAEYDLFINSTYCSSMVSQAKKSIYLVFFPHHLAPRPVGPRRAAAAAVLDAVGRQLWPPGGQRLVRLARRVRGGLLHGGREFTASYQLMLANSSFTGEWVERRWGCKAVVLPPPIDINRFADIDDTNRRRLILSVGRFFHGGKDGHNKKHLELLHAFRALHDSGRLGERWEYHLAGSLHADKPEDVEYFREVNVLAEGYPVRILANITAEDLKREYAQASIFWHGSGWGEDVESSPERLEHFGMTTCEAMAAGCVPIVMPYGGQREIVQHGVNGFHFHDVEELIAQTVALAGACDRGDIGIVAARSRKSVQRYSSENFRKHLIDLVANL